MPWTNSRAHKPDVVWSPDRSRIAFTMLDGYNLGKIYVVEAPRGRSWNGDHPPDSLIWSDLGGAVEDSPDDTRPRTTMMPEPPEDIHVIRTDRSELTLLTNGAGREKQVSWSPDGKRIAFVSDRAGNDETYVMSIGLDRRRVRAGSPA